MPLPYTSLASWLPISSQAISPIFLGSGQTSNCWHLWPNRYFKCPHSRFIKPILQH